MGRIVSPPGGETAHPEHAPQRVAASKGHKRGGNRGRQSASRQTVRAINVNADVRREARDGTDVAGWRARCTCGWNQLEPSQVAARSSWGAHAKRFTNDAHTLLRALPELGDRDQLPHPNVVERLSGDLEVLFDDRRVETAGSLTVPYRGRTAHYREDR